MKKIFTLAMVLMALTASAQTKTVSKSYGDIKFIPKQFTFGDHVYFSVRKNGVYYPENDPSSGSGTQTVTVDYDIYNDDIELVKTIKIDYTFDSQLITGQRSYDYPWGRYPTWDDVKNWLNGRPDITGFDDNNYRANTASGDDWYFYWNPSDQTLYEHRKEADYYSWVPTGTGQGPLNLERFDADNCFLDCDIFNFSQTLFNDDDKFEWLMYSEDASGNKQINIVQEGGKVLQTIALPSTVYYDETGEVTKLNGKTYLRFNDSDNTYFYLIDKSSTTGVRMKQVQSRALGSAIYNLRGQKVRSIPSDGIYIQNGRKVVIKK